MKPAAVPRDCSHMKQVATTAETVRSPQTSQNTARVFVKSTPLRCGKQPKSVYVELDESHLVALEKLPEGLNLTNDFDGDDPNVLLLEMDDSAKEIPDILLEAAVEACTHVVSECGDDPMELTIAGDGSEHAWV